MFDLTFVSFFVFIHIIGWARAQVTVPNCTDPSYAWSYNSLGQSPCLVAAYLQVPCSTGQFLIPPLPPQSYYLGPSGTDDSDLCKCNTVTYNLISACGACQGEKWISYSEWSYNCTSFIAPGTYPEAIPLQTRVPYWAYVDPIVLVSDFWNVTVAELAGDSPEVTGSATNVPTSTGSGQSTTSITSQPIAAQPTTSKDSSNGSNQSTITSQPIVTQPTFSKGSSNTGAISGGAVGGIVGGIVGVALIASIMTWFTIRRRKARSVASAESSNESDKWVVPLTEIRRSSFEKYTQG